MKVFAVLKRLDIGDRLMAVFADKDKADHEVRRLYDEHEKSIPWAWNNPFFIQETELID